MVTVWTADEWLLTGERLLPVDECSVVLLLPVPLLTATAGPAAVNSADPHFSSVAVVADIVLIT